MNSLIEDDSQPKDIRNQARAIKSELIKNCIPKIKKVLKTQRNNPLFTMLDKGVVPGELLVIGRVKTAQAA